MIKANKEQRMQPEARPVACPNDGTILEQGPHGNVLHCKFCGWTHDG
jgi:hypothetical protein